ncbi:hypothetical protein EV1_041111 [Malus domestica]
MAARQMGGFKAAGPNGFQGVFYHSFWDCIAKDVYDLVLLLSNGETCPRQLNATHIVLIPKILNPESNAFVGDRQTQDNIGIAHELFHFLKLRKTKSKFELGIKLNMHKAYDRVEWDFLDAVMEKMGFHPVWRRLIMGCVCSVNFAVILNGQPGQVVNLQKSCVYFSVNTPMDVAADLGCDLGIPVVTHPSSYLGLPAIWGRSKSRGLAYLKGRLLGKIQGWKQCTLSQGGKEVMIKAVAQAILAYSMNLFKFPDSICNELDSLIFGFWWGQKNGERKIQWVSKKEMGLPKSAGGLGFRNFKSFNNALLVKQCWRLIMEPNSLWASVLKARDLLLKGAHWQIMDGQRVWVWVDRWLPSIPLGNPTPGEDLNAIRDTFIGDLRSEDRFIWPGTKNGQYSVKTGYHWVHARFNHPMALHSRAPIVIPSRVWKLIWKLRVQAKIKHFMWKSFHGAFPTMSELFKKRSMPYPNCPICHNQEESVEHLLLFCPWVKPVWFGGALNLKIARTEVSNWVEWFISASNVLGGPNDDRLSLISFVAFSCWHIWKARCNFVYNNNLINPSQVLWAISNSASAFFEAVRRNPDFPVRRTVATLEAR